MAKQWHTNTGIGTATLSTTVVPSSAGGYFWQLEDVRLGLTATVNGTLTVTFNSDDGTLYDVELLGGTDGAMNSDTDLFWQPTRSIWGRPGDYLDVAMSIGGASWGLTVVTVLTGA